MAQTVLISGLGLMGASLAAAAQAANWDVLLHHRRPEVSAEAQERGWGKQILDPAQILPQCDVVVLGTPVSVTAHIIQTWLEQTQLDHQSGPVFTDVGSTKYRICNELANEWQNGRFIGSHPMCGSHLSGLDHADSNLYNSAQVIVCEHQTATFRKRSLVHQLWTDVGARTMHMTPEDHDHAVAEASHMPHILSALTAIGLGNAAPTPCRNGLS